MEFEIEGPALVAGRYIELAGAKLSTPTANTNRHQPTPKIPNQQPPTPTNQQPPTTNENQKAHKLEETFGDLPVWLAAENGVYLRPPARGGHAGAAGGGDDQHPVR
jgi:hypothetical protein